MVSRPDLWRRSSESISAHRVAGLSGGVFAFVITLLVLDLKLPDIAVSLTQATQHRGVMANLSGLAYPTPRYIITGLLVGGLLVGGLLVGDCESLRSVCTPLRIPGC